MALQTKNQAFLENLYSKALLCLTSTCKNHFNVLFYQKQYLNLMCQHHLTDLLHIAPGFTNLNTDEYSMPIAVNDLNYGTAALQDVIGSTSRIFLLTHFISNFALCFIKSFYSDFAPISLTYNGPNFYLLGKMPGYIAIYYVSRLWVESPC